MTRVLITAASRHGATTEVARVIASAMRERGLEAIVLDPDAVTDLEPFDAVVLGSAIYFGRWMSEATELVERVDVGLAVRPCWLFSTGPLGDPPKPGTPPIDGAEIAERIGAREHRVFAGELVKGRLGLREKVVVSAVGAAEGDFRPWPEIVAWADGIADVLVGELAGSKVGAREVPVPV